MTAWLSDRRAMLEAALAEEPLDRGWSHEVEGAVWDRVREGRFQGNEVLSVECRRTLCAITAGHQDEAARGRFQTELPLRMAGMLQHAHAVRDEDPDAMATTLYMAREGYRLPRPSWRP